MKLQVGYFFNKRAHVLVMHCTVSTTYRKVVVYTCIVLHLLFPNYRLYRDANHSVKLTTQYNRDGQKEQTVQ